MESAILNKVSFIFYIEMNVFRIYFISDCEFYFRN